MTIRHELHADHLLSLVSSLLLFLIPAAVASAEPVLPPGCMLIEGDIAVPKDFYENLDTRGCYAVNLWSNGIIPYEFDANVDATNQARAIAAMADWEAVSGVDFRPRVSDANYVYIKDDTGNWSFVGMRGGKQEIGIHNWTLEYIIAHELGHSLGLWHEQSRNDRDTYVRIIEGNIPLGDRHNFNKQPTSTEHGDYDFDSVMHYGQCSFSTCPDCPSAGLCPPPTWTENGRTIVMQAGYQAFQNIIGQRDHLSAGDKAVMAFLYPPVPIPTVSEWGLIVMTLLMLTAGTVVIRRRRDSNAAAWGVRPQ